jgi:hypothetical protein
MNQERYEIRSGEQLEIFEFTSIGLKGKIEKIVQYSQTNYKDLYNLGFGDKTLTTTEIDDLVISNNGDSEKVLATVVATLYAFTDKYKNVMVYATGSSRSRTRLYRMGISKFLDEALTDFEIYGQLDEGWEKFKKDIDYTGFIVKRKN